MRIEVAKQLHFSAARSRSPQSHSWADSYAMGANYHAWLAYTGPLDAKTGLVIELNQIKSVFEDLMETHLDHYCYQDTWQKSPTLTEMYQQIQNQLDLKQVDIKIDALQEGPFVWVESEGVFFKGPLWALGLGEALTSCIEVELPIETLESDAVQNDLKHICEDWRIYLKQAMPTIKSLKIANQSFRWQQGTLHCSQSFSSVLSHDLNLPQYTAAQNTALFGRCTRFHGHDLQLNLEFQCSPDELSNFMHDAEQHCLQLLSKKDLKQWPILSCEVLLCLFLESLPNHLSQDLSAAVLFETPRNRFRWHK